MLTSRTIHANDPTLTVTTRVTPEGEKGSMVWFWTRGTSELQIETRYDNDTSEFVVAVVSPEGSVSSERFMSMTAFKARLVDLERQLEGEHWKNTGPPLFVPEGFPNRRLRGEH